MCLVELIQAQGSSFFHDSYGYVTVCVSSVIPRSFFCCLTVWEGGSVWDLPLDTTTPGPALEQLQQLEKAKAAKV